MFVPLEFREMLLTINRVTYQQRVQVASVLVFHFRIDEQGRETEFLADRSMTNCVGGGWAEKAAMVAT